MDASPWISWVLVTGAVAAALSIYPYVATAIAYRGSDNGLAYILLVMGVGLWNAMFAAQLLDPRPLVKGFFLSLSIVGASLAGLGWFLFAGTASSTSRVSRRRLYYGTAAVLVGLNIVLVVTIPAHELYWLQLPETGTSSTFVAVAPRPLYWLSTAFLVALFGLGTALFASAWRRGVAVRYTRAYTVAGTATVVAVVASNALAPGGLSVAPLVAASLTTVGWIQASRGRPLSGVRSYVRSGRRFAR